MPRPHGGLLATCFQLLGGILADRLQQAIAHLRPRSQQPDSSSATTSDLSTSPAEQVEHLLRCDALARADRLRGLQRPPTGKDGQPAQQDLLALGEQIMAPIHQRPQGLLAGQGRRELPPVSRRKRSSSRRAICSRPSTRTRAAASSMASGMPSSRQQISARAGAVALLTAKSARAATARSMNRRTACVLGQPLQGLRSVRIGQGQGGHAPDCLAGDAQRSAAGGQHAHLRTAAHQRVGQRGTGRQQVLAVVQQQQHAACAQDTHQGLLRGALVRCRARPPRPRRWPPPARDRPEARGPQTTRRRDSPAPGRPRPARPGASCLLHPCRSW